jgi:GGDEF domain-containing protein
MPESAGVRGVTVSVGMALLRDDDQSAELFTRADHAMYTVKRVGGNKVSISEAESFRFVTG